MARGWTGRTPLAIAGAGLLASLGSVGCATSGRVTTLEQRVSALESRVDGVDRTARQAESDAAAAQKAAQSAADRADDAARTAEAIFKKHVSK
jgi:outer membrane murein-binding lipoprotein Lpp